MKKIVALLTILIMLLSISTVTYADIYENTSVDVGSSYSCYRIGSMDFLVPAYYSEEPSISDSKDAVSFIDKTYGAILSIAVTEVSDEDTQQMSLYPKKVFEAAFAAVAKDPFGTSHLGITETVTARGFYCYLTTSSADSRTETLKTAGFYNSSTKEIYILCLLYKNSLEGTYFVNDFYKYIYDDPYSYDGSAAQSSQASAQPSSSSSDWQALRDYVGIMDQYVNTMEAIDNAENFGDALDSLSNFYGSVAEYSQKYGY